MAARVNKIRHDDETRSKIKAAQIINRLMGHINGNVDLKPTQVSAALGLLGKVLPDMKSVEHSGEITKAYVARLPTPVSNIDEWKRQTATLQ